MTAITPIGVWADGRPAVPAVSRAALARMAKADWEGQDARPKGAVARFIDEIRVWMKQAKLGPAIGHPGPAWREASDPTIGWGVVYYKKTPQAVRDEVERLRLHRKGKQLPDWGGLDTARFWLNAQGVTAANRDPSKVPYYILLVGSPEQIPFADQYELDRVRAVGRLDFGADVAAYRTYVDMLIANEAAPAAGKRMVVAAARNNDQATRLSAEYLAPAVANHPGADATLSALGYKVERIDGAKAAALKAALGSDASGRAPAFSFVATHGLRSAPGPVESMSTQGAWIGSEWDQAKGAVPDAALVTGAQVGPDFCAPGSILFSLACFGAGSPQQSEYARYHNLIEKDPKLQMEPKVAAQPFVASLPRRLLSYREGGLPSACLAFVGHVDISWPTAFYDFESKQAAPATFTAFAEAILQGDTVGMATEAFARAQDDANAALNERTSKATHMLDISDEAVVAQAWIDRNNARGFIVLGDPAVRLDPGNLA